MLTDGTQEIVWNHFSSFDETDACSRVLISFWGMNPDWQLLINQTGKATSSIPCLHCLNTNCAGSAFRIRHQWCNMAEVLAEIFLSSFCAMGIKWKRSVHLYLCQWTKTVRASSETEGTLQHKKNCTAHNILNEALMLLLSSTQGHNLFTHQLVMTLTLWSWSELFTCCTGKRLWCGVLFFFCYCDSFCSNRANVRQCGSLALNCWKVNGLLVAVVRELDIAWDQWLILYTTYTILSLKSWHFHLCAHCDLATKGQRWGVWADISPDFRVTKLSLHRWTMILVIF